MLAGAAAGVLGRVREQLAERREEEYFGGAAVRASVR